jgi:Raf kinase inhibitor-like YbhB/YbcL family protein
MALQLSSPEFPNQGEIPTEFTCEGKDISPELSWANVPGGAKSLALIVDDPDAPDPAAPQTTWVHWLVYDLPAGTGGLARGTTAGSLPPGARQGVNDWKRVGYGGPCPPKGRHRYFHKLYALDVQLGDLGAVDKPRLLTAMEGHVLDVAEIFGTYQKKGHR